MSQTQTTVGPTPGPYSIDESESLDYHFVMAEDGDTLAKVYKCTTRGDGEANARLFKVAPEYSALVRRMLNMMEFDHAHELETNHEGDGPDGCTYCEWIAEARAAVADEMGGAI